jgi:hypothetical protein
MKFGITRLVAGFSGFIEIDKTEYEYIKIARANLFELLLLEETFDILIENFQEYEAELLSIASRDMVFNFDDNVSMSHERIIVSRRIVNLLSACRMYLDQSMHHLRVIYGKDSEKVEIVKNKTNSYYDNNFGYRAMEALRNYVQHRGFPIHNLTFSGQWLDIEDKENSRLLHLVIPRISVAELASDNKFNKTVLKEMQEVQEKQGLDIRPLIREYVECLGLLHEFIREITREDLAEWENVFTLVEEKVQSEFGEEAPLTHWAIAVKDKNEHISEKIGIHRVLAKRKQALQKKNAVFKNLRKRYTSNEIRRKDA